MLFHAETEIYGSIVRWKRDFMVVQGSSSKKELQLFNRVNISIQNLVSRARGGTALIQSLLCYQIIFGQNSSCYITTSSKSLVKLLLNCFTLKGFINKTAR